MSNRKVIVEVSFDRLIAALKFPEGSKIDRISFAETFNHDSFYLLIEHPDLPGKEEGERYQEVKPIFTKHIDKDGNVFGLIFSWGLPNEEKTYQV